jgi:hypothetical protein
MFVVKYLTVGKTNRNESHEAKVISFAESIREVIEDARSKRVYLSGIYDKCKSYRIQNLFK